MTNQKRDNIIFIDAANISDGGGFVLLQYLVSFLEEKEYSYKVFIRNYCPLAGDRNNFIINEGNFIQRQKNISRILEQMNAKIILCFGNFPLLFKPKDVFVASYIQSLHLLNKRSLTFGFFLRKIYFSLLVKLNLSDVYIFQSKMVENIFVEIFGQSHKRYIFPFFNDLKIKQLKASFIQNNLVKENRFVYISLPIIHKQHSFLFDVWESLANENIYPILLVTVPKEFTSLVDRINDLNNRGLQIVNVGEVSFSEALKLTYESSYCVFPSSLETLGLGLVEAAMLECKLLTPNLPYVKEVVEPSLYYEFGNKEDMIRTVKHLLVDKEIPFPKLLMKNKIDEFVKFLLK